MLKRLSERRRQFAGRHSQVFPEALRNVQSHSAEMSRRDPAVTRFGVPPSGGQRAKELLCVSAPPTRRAAVNTLTLETLREIRGRPAVATAFGVRVALAGFGTALGPRCTQQGGLAGESLSRHLPCVFAPLRINKNQHVGGNGGFIQAASLSVRSVASISFRRFW